MPEIAKTEDEAKALGYRPLNLDIHAFDFQAPELDRERDCLSPNVNVGDWCFVSKCSKDGKLIVCYCDGAGGCSRCYETDC